jgi:urease accessory protein
MSKKYLLLLSFAAGIALPLLLVPAAQAHVGHHEVGGLMLGFQHPFSGLDHILAMLAVGLWAAQLGGVARWSVPLAFLGAMILGGIVGFTGLEMPWTEQGILLSDLLLGVVVLLAVRLPLALSMSIVSIFAIFHGYAHGAEMPKGVSGWEYAVGFVSATALLHGCGLGVALAIQTIRQDKVVQFAGAGVVIGSLFVIARSAIGA